MKGMKYYGKKLQMSNCKQHYTFVIRWREDL
jgi:hypothetical protein